VTEVEFFEQNGKISMPSIGSILLDPWFQRGARVVAACLLGSLLVVVDSLKVRGACSLTPALVLSMGLFGPTVGFTIKGMMLVIYGAALGTGIAVGILAVSSAVASPWLIWALLVGLLVTVYVARVDLNVRLVGIATTFITLVPVLARWDRVGHPLVFSLWSTVRYTLLMFCVISPVITLVLISLPPVFTDAARLEGMARTAFSLTSKAVKILSASYESVELREEVAGRKELLDSALHPSISLMPHAPAPAPLVLLRPEKSKSQLGPEEAARALDKIIPVLGQLAAGMGPVTSFAVYEFMHPHFNAQKWAAVRAEIGDLAVLLRILRVDLLPVARFGPVIWSTYCGPTITHVMNLFHAIEETFSQMAEPAAGEQPQPHPQRLQASLSEFRAAVTLVQSSLKAVHPVDPKHLFALYSLFATIGLLTDLTARLAVAFPLALRGDKGKRSAAAGMLASVWAIFFHPLRSLFFAYRRLAVASWHSLKRGGRGSITGSFHVRDAFKFALGLAVLTFPLFLQGPRKFLVKYETWWAAVTFTFVYAPQVEDSVRKSVLRVVGTSAGVALAVGCVAIYNSLHHSAGSLVLVFLLRAIFFGLSITFARKTSLSYAFWLVVFIADPLLLCSLGQGNAKVGYLALSRICCTAAGSLVAVLITTFVFPQRATTLMRIDLGSVAEISAELLRSLAHAYIHGRGNDVRVDNARIKELRAKGAILLEGVARKLDDPELWGSRAPTAHSELRATFTYVRALFLLVSSMHVRLLSIPSAFVPPGAAMTFSDDVHDSYVTGAAKRAFLDLADLETLSLHSLASHLAANTRPPDISQPSLEQRLGDTLLEALATARDHRYEAKGRDGKPLAPLLPFHDLVRIACFVHVLCRVADVLPLAREAAHDLCEERKIAHLDPDLNDLRID
jgi:hypothetical protein